MFLTFFILFLYSSLIFCWEFSLWSPLTVECHHDRTSYLKADIFQIGRNTVWITCFTAFDSFTYSSSERVIEDFSSGLSCQKMKPRNKVVFKNSIDVEQSLKFTVLIWKKFLSETFLTHDKLLEGKPIFF